VIPDVASGYYGGTPDQVNLEATVPLSDTAPCLSQKSNRRKFGVIVPSTNTIVEYEFWHMITSNKALKGCGFHMGEILIRKVKWSDDAEMLEFLDQLRLELDHAVDRCCTAEPEFLIMGMSAETFFGGMKGNTEFREYLTNRTGLGVATGAEACYYALEAFKAKKPIKKIAVITPYQPVADVEVKKFFEGLGYEVSEVFGFCCVGAVEIAHVTEEMLEKEVHRLNTEDVDAFVQCGTNLAFVELADRLENEIGKPIIAINAATLWFALRENNITEPMHNCTRLCREF